LALHAVDFKEKVTPMPRRAAGALEREVLAVLWAADRPMTAVEVQAELDPRLAYTTVMTILTRLLRKGVVTRERDGRSYLFSPLVEEATLAANQMHALLRARRDRRAVLAQFVGRLDTADEHALAELLNQAQDADEDDR
jgi:predicted transcriptional regulator